MPYAWQIAGDALADLRDLESWLQEDVLDEFERVSDRPQTLRAEASGFAVYDFDRVRGGMSHVVFLKLHRDDVRRVLSLLGIADHARGAPHRPRPE